MTVFYGKERLTWGDLAFDFFVNDGMHFLLEFY